MERITIKNVRASLAHYARTLAGHGIMTAEEAGSMRIGTPYGSALYVFTRTKELDQIGQVNHNVPGFRGDSKSLGTSAREAQSRILQAHATVNDLYIGIRYDYEAGDKAHRLVMEHYGLWAEYAAIFSKEGN